MSQDGEQELDFNNLAEIAMRCAVAWRCWAKRHERQSDQADRAKKVSVLFEQQAELLAAMHRNRTEWARVTRDNLGID